MKDYKYIELTKENKEEYLDQVAELEKVVLKAMEEDGRIGQLFITGKEDILDYILSKNNTVMVAIDKENKVQSATYITQGQRPFTYNDITKYFKYGDEYQKYVKSKYKSEYEYKKDMIYMYETKLKAYEYAKQRIMQENPEYNGDIKAFLDSELKQKDNGFHEKSQLRESLNTYMSEYIDKLSESKKNIKRLYENFYWITSDDISKEFDKNIHNKNQTTKEYDEIIDSQKAKEYNILLKKGPLEIHEKPEFDIEKYYKANTENSIEIDTYITNPSQRHAGTARILVYEGIKKHIKEHFENPKNNEIFLCSTLHRENISSKYVSEFFGLKDSLFVKRRYGRDREVHICGVKREEIKKYLNHIEDKLATLYGYNPTNKLISNKTKSEIIQEQLEYEKNEYKRLNKARHYKCSYMGNVRDIQSKANKIMRLKNRLAKINDTKEVVNDGGRDD